MTIEDGLLSDTDIYVSRSRFSLPLPGFAIGIVILVFAFVGPFACLVPLRWIYQKRPNLTLNGDGILFNTLSETHFWRWTDVGPFRLSIKAGRRPQFWAYASYRADLAGAAVPATGADHVTEVTIYLNFLRCGRNEEEARKTVALLNNWRERVQGRLHPSSDSQTRNRRLL